MNINISPLIAAVFDHRGEDVSRLKVATVNNYVYAYDKVSSAFAAFIDRCTKYYNPRCYANELPEDLWIQIFVRLPVKSLLLLMSVCKNWYLLITNPSFTRKHLQFQKTMSENMGHFLLKHETKYAFSHFLFDGESSKGTSSSPLQLYHNLSHFPRGEYQNKYKIDGPVNGLYCMHNEVGAVVIFNPATNVVGFLPLPYRFLPPNEEYCNRFLYRGNVGFGIDPSDEENYKVILISSCWYEDSYDRTYAMLYTTRTNTWRHLDYYASCEVFEPGNNTYLNGSYYWMSQREYTILAFDMSENEAFRTIQTPCNGHIALQNDCINLFHINYDLNEIDIWVMMEENNWLKKKNIKGFQEPVVDMLRFWKTENDLLLVINDTNSHANSQTILYNTTTRQSSYIGPRGYSGGFKALVYYETLVYLSGEIIKYQAKDAASLIDSISSFFLEDIDDDESID